MRPVWDMGNSEMKRRLNMTTITYGREAVRNQGQTLGIGLLGRVRTYIIRSRAERQLTQLDDRMLADIGMQRSEISSLIWGK
jgi:uncharacterized protein YjiS (DUF1127 family)